MMKRALLILAVVLFFAGTSTNNIVAQISKHIVDTSKQWNDHLDSPGVRSTVCYKFGEDTLVDGHLYKKLYECRYNGYDITFSFFGLLLREEDSKVYCRVSDTFEQEIVLYDFSVQIGDTVSLYEYCYDSFTGDKFSCVVTSIDSVEIYNVNRKRVSLQCLTCEFGLTYWIEGVGGEYGFINCVCYIDGSWSNLQCCFENDELVYKVKGYDCYVYMDDRDIIKSDLYVFPTIVKDYVVVDIQGKPCVLRMFDNSGANVKTIEINQSAIIDVSSMPNGVYYIKVSRDNEQIGTSKIIKL